MDGLHIFITALAPLKYFIIQTFRLMSQTRHAKIFLHVLDDIYEVIANMFC